MWVYADLVCIKCAWIWLIFGVRVGDGVAIDRVE